MDLENIYNFMIKNWAYFDLYLSKSHEMNQLCFLFQLKGEVDDCSCKVESLDSLNNAKIYPRLQSLITKDFFRYFKVQYIH